ncbi:MAG: class I SAM-dependent methyltransferase [Thioalkalispiraceae bacterium]|jgi:2-polyprenyl-3-methyl-5-hydroxy-6-metoxy-1,4-benzoquinol methylase
MAEHAQFRPCIVCGETEKINEYCKLSDFVYVSCSQCNLIYLNNFGTETEMEEAYTGGFLKSLRRKLTGPLRKMPGLKNFNHLQQRGSSIYHFAKQELGNQANPRLLDIGCNKGFILSSAAEDGCDVFGIDLVREVTTPFKNSFPQYSKNIFCDKFSKVARDFADDFFEIITAIDVVEHLEDPINDLRQVFRILKKDGVFLVQTPDTECPEAAQQKCSWGALKPLEHLHLFNKHNFAQLCKSIGFTTVSTHQPFEYADGNFVAVIKK